MATNYQKDIERVSEETLNALETIASAAEASLHESYSIGPAALASVDTFTDHEAVRTLSGIEGARRRSLETLAREPAIARVMARTDNDKLIISTFAATRPPGPRPRKTLGWTKFSCGPVGLARSR
jgi:hypothetical protein